MKTKVLIALCLLVFGGFSAPAQHCPYDGSEMILVRLVDENNDPIVRAAGDLTLAEIENANADACSFSSGLIKRAFAHPLDTFVTRYKGEPLVYQQRCEGCEYIAPDQGFYSVIIGQGESYCMISDGNGGYASTLRRFEVRYRDGKSSVRVERSNIHSLCTDAGKWSRIKPIEMRVSTKN